MQITLMHNPKAGDAGHGKKELVQMLSNAGHEVRYQSTKSDNYQEALKNPADLIVVAGGDGAVGKVARELIDTGLPLMIFPLGTANNLARSLGFTEPIEEMIEGIENGNKRVFDVGVAIGPWGTRYIFEAVGAGLLTDYICEADKEAKANGAPSVHSKEQELTRHVALMRRLLHDYRAREWKIDIDGEDISDRYILWEAMNIRSVGPALYLAPQAATKDGQLDFVCVRESDRDLMMEHLDARLAGEQPDFPLPLRKFRELKIKWKKSAIRFDDDVWPKKKDKPEAPAEIKITVKPSALVILQPGTTP